MWPILLHTSCPHTCQHFLSTGMACNLCHIMDTWFRPIVHVLPEHGYAPPLGPPLPHPTQHPPHHPHHTTCYPPTPLPTLPTHTHYHHAIYPTPTPLPPSTPHIPSPPHLYTHPHHTAHTPTFHALPYQCLLQRASLTREAHYRLSVGAFTALATHMPLYRQNILTTNAPHGGTLPYRPGGRSCGLTGWRFLWQWVCFASSHPFPGGHVLRLITPVSACAVVS